jgi:5'-3' exonuclease
MKIIFNLTIDLNYILNKTVYSLHKANVLFGSLYESLNTSIINHSNLYNFNTIYIVSDSKEKSWRKNIYPDYKAGRKKDDDIDWNFVYETYNEFKNNLPVKSKLVELSSIEGDDWISYLISETNSKKQSNFVVSNDHDIIQLLKFDINDMYINIMSNEIFGKAKLFMPKNYDIFVNKLEGINKNDNDIFKLNKNKVFARFLKEMTEKYEIEEVDPIQTLLIKLISGDKSDNIESVYSAAGSTGKVRGIGTAGAEAMLEMYVKEFGEPDLNDDDLLENLADIIAEKKKLKTGCIEEIKEKLIFNRKLIDLKALPNNIVEKMKNTIKI